MGKTLSPEEKAANKANRDAAKAAKKANAGSAASDAAPRSIPLEFKVGTPAKSYHFNVHNVRSDAEAKAALAADLTAILKQCA